MIDTPNHGHEHDNLNNKSHNSSGDSSSSTLTSTLINNHSSESIGDDTDDDSKYDFITLRKMASTYMRNHPDDFSPFLGLLSTDEEYKTYCDKVESINDAEWGGQLEIRALCYCLNRKILIYSADSPLLIMGGDEVMLDCDNKKPLKIAYHRHYYALGEHYNSVTPIIEECSCGL